MPDKASMSIIKAWECTGCGRIEAPRPCLGICSDRIVELPRPEAYRQMQQEHARLVRDHARMRALILRLAGTTPRPGCWEANYRAVQERACRLLGQLEEDECQNGLPGKRWANP